MSEWDVYTRPAGRVRRRPQPTFFTARLRRAEQPFSAPALSTPRQAPDRDTPSSQPQSTSTIRHLRVAFQDTPPQLKELEEGWRVARRQAARPVVRPVLGERRVNVETKADPPPAADHDALRKPGYSLGKAGRDPRAQSRAPHMFLHARNKEDSAGHTTGLPTPPSSPQPKRSARRHAEEGDRPAQVRFAASRPASSPKTDKAAAVVEAVRPPVPPQSSPEAASRAVKAQAHAHAQPRAIVAHPLPPTRRPQALDRCSGGTINVHAGGGGMTLVVGGQVARVNDAGDVVRVSGGASATLRLAEEAGWSARDHELWRILSRLVNEFKRHTPRIKVYTALGELGITCSAPPDLVLSFVQDGAKVRLRYSLSRREASVDTATSGSGEHFRSRRRAPLRWTPRDTPSPGSALGLAPDDWGGNEQEAVRRLWALRDEWARFVPGYM